MQTPFTPTALARKCLVARKNTTRRVQKYLELCKDLSDQAMKDELFGFLQVDIHVPNELMNTFREFCPLPVVDTNPEQLIPRHMKEYQGRTGWKTTPGTKKLLGVTKAENILLYSPLLKWCFSHRPKVTTVHKYLKYKPGKLILKSGEAKLRHRPGDKQLGDTYKLKGNSFYGKMIEDLTEHLKATFATDEELVNESFR